MMGETSEPSAQDIRMASFEEKFNDLLNFVRLLVKRDTESEKQVEDIDKGTSEDNTGGHSDTNLGPPPVQPSKPEERDFQLDAKVEKTMRSTKMVDASALLVITPFLPPGFSRVSARKTRQPEPSRPDSDEGSSRIKYSQERRSETHFPRFSPTRCNLVREPRPLGKRFTSATTRNFRIVKSSSGQAGISVRKLTPWHKEHSDGLRSQGSYLANPSSPLCKACTVEKSLPDSQQVDLRARAHWKEDTSMHDVELSDRQEFIGRKLSDGTKNVKIRHRELGQICARTGTRFEKKRAGSKTHFFSRTAAFARRVFPARNKLIREPGCVGKIMTPATSWNSRFADSIPRLTGICIGKVHKNSSDTPTSGSHNSLVRTPIRANFISLERGRRELSDDMPHDPF
uniref:Uncharacterized protein n=1 Tax=Fagus sylvatica TaxID=28930 RepID=A0A2N9FQ56_FAGSY